MTRYARLLHESDRGRAGTQADPQARATRGDRRPLRRRASGRACAVPGRTGRDPSTLLVDVRGDDPRLEREHVRVVRVDRRPSPNGCCATPKVSTRVKFASTPPRSRVERLVDLEVVASRRGRARPGPGTPRRRAQRVDVVGDRRRTTRVSVRCCSLLKFGSACQTTITPFAPDPLGVGEAFVEPVRVRRPCGRFPQRAAARSRRLRIGGSRRRRRAYG